MTKLTLGQRRELNVMLRQVLRGGQELMGRVGLHEDCALAYPSLRVFDSIVRLRCSGGFAERKTSCLVQPLRGASTQDARVPHICADFHHKVFLRAERR